MQTHAETVLVVAPIKARSPRPTAAERRRQVDETRASRLIEAHEATVERLARDVEHIIARQESVESDDLLTLGWSGKQIADLMPGALEIVRGRAMRELDPIN